MEVENNNNNNYVVIVVVVQFLTGRSQFLPFAYKKLELSSL